MTGVPTADPHRGAGTAAASNAHQGRTAATYVVKSFEYNGYHLSYEVHGKGRRPILYLSGLLLDTGLNRGVADALASRGNRVILLDLLGHGRSDKPRQASAYRLDLFADQVVALLDELGVDKAVLGGPSLGANVSLIVAAHSPERVKGLVLEMPVLEDAVPFIGMTFIPIIYTLRCVRLFARLISRVARLLPRSGMGPLDAVMNAISLDPEEISAVIHGVISGPVAPKYDERAAIEIPALVVGHKHDLIHPLSDANALVGQLPNGRLVRAGSVAELRMRPKRLTAEIVDFLDEIWEEGEDSARASG